MKDLPNCMTVNRREFIKTSVITAAAVGILSQGTALGQANSGTVVIPWQKKEIQYGIVLIAYPVDSVTGLFQSQIITSSPRQADTAIVGELELDVVATDFPACNLKLTTQERQGVIPHSKVFYDTKFTQEAFLVYDADKMSFLHKDDRKLPVTPTSGTNNGDKYVAGTAQVTLNKLKSDVGPWRKGQTPPKDPTPAKFSSSNTNESIFTDGILSMAFSWKEFGWKWKGIYRTESEITVGIAGFFEWKPGKSECETQDVELIWTLSKVQRSRILETNPRGDYMAMPTNESVEGWSNWGEY